MNVIDSWKSETVFKKQLELNLIELSSESNYPKHWKVFLKLIKSVNPKSMLDVGCGCGAYYKLCLKHFPNIVYTGIDYADDAINLAKKTFGYSEFFVKNLFELTPDYVAKFDIIHLGAVLDVLPNGDEALKFILSLQPKKIIIGRVLLTDAESSSYIYKAYDEIDTYRYSHNALNFINVCETYGYNVILINDTILLKLK